MSFTFTNYFQINELLGIVIIGENSKRKVAVGIFASISYLGTYVSQKQRSERIPTTNSLTWVSVSTGR